MTYKYTNTIYTTLYKQQHQQALQHQSKQNEALQHQQDLAQELNNLIALVEKLEIELGTTKSECAQQIENQRIQLQQYILLKIIYSIDAKNILNIHFCEHLRLSKQKLLAKKQCTSR